MDLSNIGFPAEWTFAFWVVALLVMPVAVMMAKRNAQTGYAITPAWHGGIATCVLLWSLQATVSGNFTFHLLGMAGLTLALGAPLALVLGAEGKGLRQLTRETCAVVARMDMPGAIKSLNVSNAAVLALYIGTSRLGLMG